MTQPAASTWSDRFEGTLHPAIVRFNASIDFDIKLIEYDLNGSIAHSKMLAKVGIISDTEAVAIESGLEQIREEYRSDDWQLINRMTNNRFRRSMMVLCCI